MKSFDFDNDTSKIIFSYPYIYYMASQRLQGEEQFHSKNYLLNWIESLKVGYVIVDYIIAHIY